MAPPSGVLSPGVALLETTPDSTSNSISIPPEVIECLGKAGFRPGPATEIAEDGWPAVIARSEGEPRTMIRHGRVYLPQGYEPESEGTDEGLPRVVKSQYGIRFILIKGDSFMMGALNNGIAFTDEERPSHHVILSTFYMQETETAIGEFDRFCKETGRGPNDPDLETFHEVRNSLLKDMSEEACRKRPASGVSRKLAELYAHSVGGSFLQRHNGNSPRVRAVSRSVFMFGATRTMQRVRARARLTSTTISRARSAPGTLAHRPVIVPSKGSKTWPVTSASGAVMSGRSTATPVLSLIQFNDSPMAKAIPSTSSEVGPMTRHSKRLA